MPFILAQATLSPEEVEQIGRMIAEALPDVGTPPTSYGIWGLLLFVVFRWWMQEKSNREGPRFLKNGTMETITDKLGTKIGKSVSDEIGTRLVGPLQRQASAMEELVREILDLRICPYRSSDAERIAEQDREKRRRLEAIRDRRLKNTMTEEDLDHLLKGDD